MAIQAIPQKSFNSPPPFYVSPSSISHSSSYITFTQQITMSSSQDIAARDHSSDPAPTPQNTPLDNQILKNRPADMGKPTVADIGEGEEEDGEEDVGGFNPASLLAQVCL